MLKDRNITKPLDLVNKIPMGYFYPCRLSTLLTSKDLCYIEGKWLLGKVWNMC